ncbi:uncharacterized protein I303_106850 [Kwoniella dejecticola CBS 10117]|uniref:Uncharacterized protein n=1 Tax=Kwoniella dejecticola CBS 10117 TaxID=1296121 RepID=A0A1A5ZTH6_9TREE|nr:uncharacterized protein I303_08509 [Kwoniella dejecticola CBS 10117]OBR81126.1 hypothetical protein I303_08509 [Kwoniella dejecticola CBS 10117]
MFGRFDRLRRFRRHEEGDSTTSDYQPHNQDQHQQQHRHRHQGQGQGQSQKHGRGYGRIPQRYDNQEGWDLPIPVLSDGETILNDLEVYELETNHPLHTTIFELAGDSAHSTSRSCSHSHSNSLSLASSEGAESSASTSTSTSLYELDAQTSADTFTQHARYNTSPVLNSADITSGSDRPAIDVESHPIRRIAVELMAEVPMTPRQRRQFRRMSAPYNLDHDFDNGDSHGVNFTESPPPSYEDIHHFSPAGSTGTTPLSSEGKSAGDSKDDPSIEFACQSGIDPESPRPTSSSTTSPRPQTVASSDTSHLTADSRPSRKPSLSPAPPVSGPRVRDKYDLPYHSTTSRPSDLAHSESAGTPTAPNATTSISTSRVTSREIPEIFQQGWTTSIPFLPSRSAHRPHRPHIHRPLDSFDGSRPRAWPEISPIQTLRNTVKEPSYSRSVGRDLRSQSNHSRSQSQSTSTSTATSINGNPTLSESRNTDEYTISLTDDTHSTARSMEYYPSLINTSPIDTDVRIGDRNQLYHIACPEFGLPGPGPGPGLGLDEVDESPPSSPATYAGPRHIHGHDYEHEAQHEARERTSGSSIRVFGNIASNPTWRPSVTVGVRLNMDLEMGTELEIDYTASFSSTSTSTL